jgi:uncharacterized protein
MYHSKNNKKPGVFLERYGPTALIAGASEGLGAAFAWALAARGLDLVLVARRNAPLEETAKAIIERYGVKVLTVSCDLGEEKAPGVIKQATTGLTIGCLVYNAAYSHIGPFLSAGEDEYRRTAMVNVSTPMELLYHYGGSMVQRGKGGVVLMSSLAGLQGAGFLAAYGATKAFARVLGEGLWYEWRPKGVDVIACCAGAIETPNYLNSRPLKAHPLAPKPQDPAVVAEGCLRRIGRYPSYVSGCMNCFLAFCMKYFLSRRQAIKMMGNALESAYHFEK